MKGNLHFKTNVQLKSIIGKDLINDDNIAILELVKNSFDADAKIVSIKYHNLKSNDDLENNFYSQSTSKIIIQDDGIGMSLNDIENKWLNIAYSEKKTNNRQHNRMMAGAKGVGRFSCDRLGEYLNLYTKTKKDNNYILLKIDWKQFEIDNAIDKEIQTIDLEFEELTKSQLEAKGIEPFNSGVRLEIIKLRRKWILPKYDKEGKFIGWNVSRFIELKKYLEKLINPNQAFETNDFGVFIKADELKEENDLLENHQMFIGQVENRIFEKLDFKSTLIESEIIEEGKVVYTELKDKGETIFWIKERNDHYPLIKDAKVVLYYLNPYAKAFFTKQTGIRSVDYGSIFLFINGFRVPPYGEEGNDWLGIDQRKAQGYARFIGLREFVGRIEILDSENDFQIITNREGIVKNDSYYALTEQSGNKSYFFKTLRRLERYVVDGLNWDSIPKSDLININEIENKIISGETSEDDLKYREDIETKRTRTYQLIHAIVAAKPERVIEIYINENLILDKVEQEKRKSEEEFDQLLRDFEEKKIDPDTLSRILKQKAGKNKELEKQIKDFTKFSTNELTSKAILDLQAYKKSVNDQKTVIQSLKKQLELAEIEKKEAEEEAEDVKKELTEARSQNLFLKSIKSQEFDDVVNLMHHIGISTGTIQNYIKGAVFKLENNIEFEKDELKGVFSKLNYELNKIFSISKFATKANFKLESKETMVDVVSFIEQYFINIVSPFLQKKISLIVYEPEVEGYETLFKPIELTIILDNLINNSKKALKAKELVNKSFDQKIEIWFLLRDESQLQVIYRDNGIGIKAEHRDKIFDYGFTTTEGSGLGLTHIQELMQKNGGDIELAPDNNGAAEFILTFNKR